MKLTGSPVGLSVGFKVGLIVYWYEIQERLVGTYRSSLVMHTSIVSKLTGNPVGLIVGENVGSSPVGLIVGVNVFSVEHTKN